MSKGTSAATGYGAAVLLILLALAARIALQPLLGIHQPFVTFYLAVFCTAWFAGRGPGVFAAALGGLLSQYFFVPPTQGIEHWLASAFYFAVAITGVFLIDSDRRTRRSAEESLARLHEEEARRERAEESEILHRRLRDQTLASIGDAVISTDAEGRIRFMNSVAERLTGWKADEAKGVPADDVFRIVNEQTGTRVESPVSKVLQEGTIQGLANQTELIHKDGSHVPIDDSGAPIRDERGNLMGVVLVFRDVTERRRAQAELAASEKSFRSVFDTAGAGIAKLDPETLRFLRVNEKLCAMTGYSHDELLARTAIDITAREDRHKEAELWKSLMREGMLERSAQKRYVTKAGDWFWIDESLSTVVDESGKITTIVLVAHDISDVKRAEGALRESEGRLKQALAAGKLGVWTLDCAGIRPSESLLNRVVSFSPRGAEIAGVPADCHDPNLWANSLHPDDRKETLRRLEAALKGGPEYRMEYRLVREDGEVRWVSSSATVVRDEHGAPLRLVGVNQDITERKTFEQRMFHNQKLESVGLLAGGIAHEFNNLLVGVLGNASMGKEAAPPGSEQARYFEDIIRAAQQAAHLTRQMLAYAGKGRFVIARVHLADVIPAVVKLVGPSLPSKVELVLELGRDLAPVEADAGQMQQMVMNLIMNAAEATAERGGRVIVRTAMRDVSPGGFWNDLDLTEAPAGSYVAIEVSDGGMGMDAATKARMFDPFFTTKFVGRGLGLAAVAGVVRAHLGAIQVTSAPGKGTTVVVLLPSAQASAPAAPAPAPSIRAREARRGEGTILVVDDEAVVQQTVKKALERFGYAVLMAASGPEAIEIFRREHGRICLVLLDLSMPGMDGRETLAELRKIDGAVKVLISSGYSEAEVMEMFEPQSVGGFIQKPYRAADLTEKVRSACEAPPTLAGSRAS
jgi:PAS domain S-box-containing protein